MTLEQISWASQTIAALAVIASLVYAALQFRVYAKAARETRFIAAHSDIQEFRRILATDADCARIYRDGLADLSMLESVDQWRFGALMQMVVTNFQYQLQFEDVFDPANINNWNAVMHRPGFRQWWANGRRFYPLAAVARVDAVLSQSQADGGG